MTLYLDPPCRIGEIQIAVLADTQVSHHAIPGGVGFVARKIPAAVLIEDSTGLHAHDLAGRRLDIATLEAACPGLTATMTDDAVR